MAKTPEAIREGPTGAGSRHGSCGKCKSTTKGLTTNVKTCGQNDSLDKVARVMWNNDCGSLPVLDQDNRVVGILTDRDIAMAAHARGLPLLHSGRGCDGANRGLLLARR